MNMGFRCWVYGYKRGKYDINGYPSGIKVEELDTLKERDYLYKAIKEWKDICNIVTYHKPEKRLFYAFGFFNALICTYKRVKFIYEISDVFYAYPRLRYIQWLLKWIDRLLIKKASLTIMTSGGFQEFFSISRDNLLIIPNKVSPFLLHAKRKPLNMNEKKIRFAFVGSIRYESIFRFAETIGEGYPQHSFMFYGSAVGPIKSKIECLLSKYDNIKYHGVYKNPEDLERIYSNIDIVVACYDIKSENERIAEPNKLYEALFFCKPIIVSNNIYLARRVHELNCGYSINASNRESIVSYIDNLDINDVNRISKMEYETPVNDIIDTPTQLESFLSKL